MRFLGSLLGAVSSHKDQARLSSTAGDDREARLDTDGGWLKLARSAQLVFCGLHIIYRFSVSELKEATALS